MCNVSLMTSALNQSAQHLSAFRLQRWPQNVPPVSSRAAFTSTREAWGRVLAHAPGPFLAPGDLQYRASGRVLNDSGCQRLGLCPRWRWDRGEAGDAPIAGPAARRASVLRLRVRITALRSG